MGRVASHDLGILVMVMTSATKMMTRVMMMMTVMMVMRIMVMVITNHALLQSQV